MPMSYKKLFHLLIDRDIKESDLWKGAGFSAPILAKLRKGQPISTDILCRICNFLQVQPGDIMECTEVTISRLYPPEPPRQSVEVDKWDYAIKQYVENQKTSQRK